VAWEEYQTKRDEIYQEVDSEVLKNMAATAPYGIYDQLADINRDSSGNIMAGRNLGGVSDGCEMSYADALKYFKESK
jgi:hypothetical protein